MNVPKEEITNMYYVVMEAKILSFSFFFLSDKTQNAADEIWHIT